MGGIVCVAFLMSFLHDCHGKRWNMDLTHPESLNDNAVLEDLVKLHVIQVCFCEIELHVTMNCAYDCKRLVNGDAWMKSRPSVIPEIIGMKSGKRR